VAGLPTRTTRTLEVVPRRQAVEDLDVAVVTAATTDGKPRAIWSGRTVSIHSLLPEISFYHKGTKILSILFIIII